MFIPDPDLDFYPSRIPDPGIKKAPDPGSGSATMLFRSFRSGVLLFKPGQINNQWFLSVLNGTIKTRLLEDFKDFPKEICTGM
jgi:hypothetical protein